MKLEDTSKGDIRNMPSKKRAANITDLDCQNLRRYREYNPLFDILIDDFDAAFIENEVSDDYI